MDLVRFILLTLFFICFARGDTLHFNTEFTSNCSNIGQVSCCDLLDSNFWIENKSPGDGDGIIINAAEEDLCFSLLHPLKLASVQTNLTQATIVVRNTLSIINLLEQNVWMSLSAGLMRFGKDLELSLLGNITMGNITVNSLALQYESTLKVQNLTVTKNFTSDSSTAVYCDYFYTGSNRFNQDGLVECTTIVMDNSLVWINGYMKADTINSTTYFHIEEDGNVDVNTLEVRALSVHGNLTSTNDIHITYGPYVRGIINAPKLYLAPTALLYGTGLVNGSVVSHGAIGATFDIQDPPTSSSQLTITGDLSAANNGFRVAIRSTPDYFYQSKLVVHGIAVITNMTIGVDFANGYEIAPFTCVVMEFRSAVGEPHTEASFRARLDISQNATALVLSGHDWYIKSPVDEPLGSVTPDNDDTIYYWKIAAIGLACFAFVLLVTIIIMIVRRSMAKKEHKYDLIVE